MTKETFYFSHDYNARSDAKIKKLIYQHGMQGYGIYWAIIEDLYNNDNCLELNFGLLSYELRSDEEIIKSIINDFELFQVSHETFYSNSIQDRLEMRNQKSEKARTNASKRWNDANAMQTQCDGNALKERKVKERKVNSISNDIEIYIAPKKEKLTTFDKSEYFNFEKFRQALPEWSEEKCKHYYDSALNYSESKGAKYINWISAIKNWDRKESYETRTKKQTYGKNGYESAKNERSELRKQADEFIASKLFGNQTNN
jgi:hypothetical protein